MSCLDLETNWYRQVFFQTKSNEHDSLYDKAINRNNYILKQIIAYSKMF